MFIATDRHQTTLQVQIPHIHFGSQITHLEVSTKTNHPLNRTLVGSYREKEKKFRDLNHITSADAGTYPAKAVTDLTPIYQNITFSNVTASVQPGHRAGLIFGLPEAYVSNVLFQNVDITADKAFGIFYAQGVRLMNCKIITPEGTNIFDSTHAQIEIIRP